MLAVVGLSLGSVACDEPLVTESPGSQVAADDGPVTPCGARDVFNQDTVVDLVVHLTPSISDDEITEFQDTVLSVPAQPPRTGWDSIDGLDSIDTDYASKTIYLMFHCTASPQRMSEVRTLIDASPFVAGTDVRSTPRESE